MDFFAFLIAALFILALIDLSVGVSNDAVNFLNSAIGSQVASRRTIMIVATAGILIGALFSSGIMEVARKGIFNPEMFTFADVMVVFLAVMIADVLLLDLFNTFGMPTSTTVSIVFELLGAATAVAIIHVTHTPDAPPFFEFINGRNALAIVAGILLSVVIAFVVGTLVQFMSRFLFTFEDSRHTALARIGWSAVALTTISWFLFIKGLKGAGFVTGDVQTWVLGHQALILGGGFLFWLGASFVLRQLGMNPLAFVVLAGTFALAMAFASNDLVNFIGVPLAGFESWKAWSASGVSPETYTMEVLTQPVQSSHFMLLAAGAVMAVTLWVSSKARSVTQTEVTLARQGEGAERFRPGPLSRFLVRTSLAFGHLLRAMTPPPWQTEVERRFTRDENSGRVADAPAFDLLRASVNLAVASILIAIATSMKLPLSTTFVSFMVAMGTSLADRAWGRDSAAYRVAGVLSVLGGWFGTAAAAFLMAAFFATLISVFGPVALGALLVLVGFTLYRSFRFHGEREQRRARSRSLDASSFGSEADLLRTQMNELLGECARSVEHALLALTRGDRKHLERARQSVEEIAESSKRKELVFVRVLKRVRPEADEGFLAQLETLACEQDLFQSIQTIVDTVEAHVLNAHERPTSETTSTLERYLDSQRVAVALMAESWDRGKPADREAVEVLGELMAMLEAATRQAVADLYHGSRPVKNTTLVLTVLTELADFVREMERADRLMAPALRNGQPASERAGRDARSSDPLIQPA
ncbi:MAG: inorganic phosphate transporter [Xanthomonadales bacterium]|nr:inorganic phosphate transporter [Xanthomonadales bacterium]